MGAYATTEPACMKSNRLRIVGGKWRSRMLHFPSVNALRPTPDAVRETLFNWLARDVVGRDCLDLYAGSGALGFEAVSRGARSAVLVEKHPRVVKALRENKKLIDQDDQISVIQCAALQYLPTCQQQFDLIFLDPPYASDELAKACWHLEKHQLLKPETLIYLESPAELKKLPIPDYWQVLKEAVKGAVRYTLLINVPAVKAPLDE